MFNPAISTRYIVALVALVFSISPIIAQEAYPVPDFINTVLYHDANSKTLKSLERPAVNTGARATGLYSGESLLFVPGTTSPIQFRANAVPAFIVKVSPGVDPSTQITLIKYQVNERKKQREYILGKAGLGGTGTTVNGMQVDYQKVGENVYRIVPVVPLTPGEYSFGNEAKVAFSFSVVSETGTYVNPGSNPGNTRASNSGATYDNGACEKGKKMKRIGIGLSIGGGASFITSVALLAAGTSLGSGGLIAAGGVFMVPALGGIGAGIPLAIIGSVKAKKNCGTASNFSINAGQSGVGLAYNF